jgi:asparagine synthase (glutamine-hydrolysing)
MTGFDGDGLFSSWRWERAQAVLHRVSRPHPRDLLRVGLALAPATLRARVMGPRTQVDWADWLRSDARREVEAAMAADEAAEPRRWDDWVARYARSRFHRLPPASLALLGTSRDVEVVHPLADPGFLAALARTGGAAGFGPRTEAVRTLFGDLLPPETVNRTSKGEFGAALWGPGARAFAEGWTGDGVDSELVDPDALRSAWLDENPPLAAATLLQDAWLATRTG